MKVQISIQEAARSSRGKASLSAIRKAVTAGHLIDYGPKHAKNVRHHVRLDLQEFRAWLRSDGSHDPHNGQDTDSDSSTSSTGASVSTGTLAPPPGRQAPRRPISNYLASLGVIAPIPAAAPTAPSMHDQILIETLQAIRHLLTVIAQAITGGAS